ncbi:pyruvate kinase [Hydrogenophaga taeniospiralis]|uniref:pyruvate kinase n=1 Tax=Hydrogenophaga taeniospiralis TaxID=65656 RepID=UPI001CF9FA0B|nr:pyruvate kinase [Hydrogenophaga taeniospiralis]UCU94521.1 pyruvate kinase [Hydrogenophaga taeniospiralis]
MLDVHTPARSTPPSASDHPWNTDVCLALIQRLWALRKSMLAAEHRYALAIERAGAHQRDSARNLVHFLAMRATDLRGLQSQLAWLGVSSLGRSESHVLANVDKVLGILHRLTGQAWQELSPEEPAGSVTGPLLLQRHTDMLLGPAVRDRHVRIMVTLPSEAATDPALVRRLVQAGMDVARINCAHDDATAWKAMARLVRRAAKRAQRDIQILMDLGGPKIRTGAIAPRAPVLKLKPVRDELGFAVQAARLRLVQGGAAPALPDADAQVVVDPDWLARLRVGTQIHLTDARGKKRSWLVVASDADGVVAECLETCYLTPDTALTCKSPRGHKLHTVYPEGIPALPGAIRLHRGDRVQLNAEAPEHTEAGDAAIPRIPCTLPQVFGQVRVGERVWFDDGRIGGVVRRASSRALEVEIVQARAGGEQLMADKGINFPDSQLALPALTDKDLEDLQTVAQVADLVGLSFAQQPDDVHQLLQALQALRAPQVGVILKIETLQGFENLPELLLAAMAAPSAGVMIARGDLAVECGYERLAEVQEEMLWCAEAAHMPVIWATQVLETLAKTGVPSRAEISDASMGVRAECVMLNKGPYIAEAIHMLDDILRRMAGHQTKKTPLLRALRAWEPEDAA